MPRHTKAWWVCGKCDKPVAKVGRPSKKLLRKHIEICPSAGFWIKQITQ